jgi:hypothetical protein
MGTSGAVAVASINNGQTYLRNHIRWGFQGTTSTTVNIHAVEQNIVSFGLATVAGTISTAPPDARLNSGDVSPPLERWVYWETRAPVVAAIDDDAGVIVWRDSGATEETDTRGQVLATGLAGGDNLFLWASWAAPFAWDTSGAVVLWQGISTLIKT